MMVFLRRNTSSYFSNTWQCWTELQRAVFSSQHSGKVSIKTECFWFVLCGLILWLYCHFPFRITWQTSVNDAIQCGATSPLFEDVCVLVTVFSLSQCSACYSVQLVTLGCCSKSVNHINYKTVQRTNRNKNGESQLSLRKRNSPFGEGIEVARASTETLREFRYKYCCRFWCFCDRAPLLQ